MADRTEEILVHLQYLREGQDQTIAHLTRLNGRMGKAETTIAVLQERTDEGRTAGRNWGAGAGAFFGGFVAVLVSVFGGGK